MPKSDAFTELRCLAAAAYAASQEAEAYRDDETLNITLRILGRAVGVAAELAAPAPTKSAA